MSIKVGIIDDHLLFRRGIAELIQSESTYDIILSVGTVEELAEKMESGHVPDILLLDIKLKHSNGMNVFEGMKKDYPDVKVVVLTMHNEKAYIRKFIEAGVHGYLLKDVDTADLFMTLRRVMEDGMYFGAEVSAALIQSIQSREKLKHQGVQLSEGEIEVLRLICQGLTAKEIGDQIFKSVRTVDGYRQNLLIKTNSKNVAALVSWAYENGIL